MSTSSNPMAGTRRIPTYRYRVTVGYDEMMFSAVSGLQMESTTIEYKDSSGDVFQMPGQAAMLNISLKRGILTGQSQLFDWLNTISSNQVEKKDISISLLNEAGNEAQVTWNVVNAFPIKLSSPNFDASSNEVAIEELSLLADGLTIEFY